MIKLCDILGISVNELLSGERLDAEEYRERAESHLVELREEQEQQSGLRTILFWMMIVGIWIFQIAYYTTGHFLACSIVCLIGAIVLAQKKKNR